MPQLTAPEKEEVVVEPDLPVDDPDGSPAPSPAGEPQDEQAEAKPDPKAHYDRLLAAMPPDEPVYVAGTRAPRLKVGEYTLEPGDVVPGAHGWPRREAYERLGRIERR